MPGIVAQSYDAPDCSSTDADLRNVSSEWRPGQGGPFAAGLGVPARPQQLGHALLRRPDLAPGEVLVQLLPQIATQLVAEAFEHLDRLGGQRLAGPAPEQRAQLRVDGEADAVVDAVHVT